MKVSISDILDVLAAHDIRPFEDEFSDSDFPGIGEMQDGETVYSTSISEVFQCGNDLNGYSDITNADNPRLFEWWSEVETIIDQKRRRRSAPTSWKGERIDSPEPYCAWYCPIHYFGFGWGIYIREECILSTAIDIANFVHWHVRSLDSISNRKIAWDLLKSAFYIFFLHEQFHHKVESLGFRLLVATGKDCYRSYKRNVYRSTYRTLHCLEESLANAESVRRSLNEERYKKSVHSEIRRGMRQFLRASIPMQPYSYGKGLSYVEEIPYRNGLYDLQSRVLDGAFPPRIQAKYWSIAPNMTTSLFKVSDEIYTVLPEDSLPIFPPTGVDPGYTVSSKELEQAFTKYYGFRLKKGGKGSHRKLDKPNLRPVVLPGNKKILPPGIVRDALSRLGNYPLSRLPDVLAGKVAARV